MRAAPGAGNKEPSPGGATEIDRWDSSNHHRAPRGARSNLSRQLPGAARCALPPQRGCPAGDPGLAPGYSLPRLRRCCSFLSEDSAIAAGSGGCCDAAIDSSCHQLTIGPAEAVEFQLKLKQQHTAASGSEATELKELNKPTDKHGV